VEATEWSVGSIEDSRASSWLTVERAAYVAVGFLAAALRFVQLGLRPLTEGEAAQALAAFHFSHGTIEAAPAGTIPALFTGNVAAFTLFGGSDAAARWLPALAGLILVLLPYGLRGRLGRGGALAASLLLALSPTAVYYSRALDGAILVATCGLAMVVGLVNYFDSHRPTYLYLAAAALGLGLCAGPATVTLLLIFGAYAVWLFASARWLNRDRGRSALKDAWSAARGEPGLLTWLGVTLAAVFGLVATTLVLHPAGIGNAADLLGAWIRGFGPGAGGQHPVYLVLVMLRYELLVLLLGLIAVGWWIRFRGGQVSWLPRQAHPGSAFSHTGLLVFWAAAAAILVLVVGDRLPGNLLLVVVPLALLAGQGLEQTWHWLAWHVPWREMATITAVALGLVVFLYLWIARATLIADSSTVSILGLTLYTTTGYLLLVLLAVLLLAALVAVAWYWRGARLVLASVWLTVVVVLSLFGFRTMWGASFANTADPRELLNLEPTPLEVRYLVTELETLSETRLNDTHALPVTVEAQTGPVVAWYLRGFHKQTAVDSLANQPAPPDTLAAITLAAQNLPIGETFRGQSFPLHAYWQPWGLDGRQWLRWFLFSEAYQPVVDREAVLWAATQYRDSTGTSQ
jgi:uncharacterized protein (TIGR03663 family)